MPKQPQGHGLHGDAEVFVALSEAALSPHGVDGSMANVPVEGARGQQPLKGVGARVKLESAL
jgi:hypothetical protein